MGKQIKLFTDGGAIKINNEYYGSCSFEVNYKKQYFTFSDPVSKGTNNFYELKAIRDGLRFVVSNWKRKDLHSIEVWVISDSQYAISCITEWFDNWVERNGKYFTRGGKEVSNIGLIIEIREILEQIPKYRFLKIRSHIGHDLGKTYKEFKEKNKIDISFTEYLLLVKFNENCDARITKAFNIKRRNIADSLGVDLI